MEASRDAATGSTLLVASATPYVAPCSPSVSTHAVSRSAIYAGEVASTSGSTPTSPAPPCTPPSVPFLLARPGSSSGSHGREFVETPPPPPPSPPLVLFLVGLRRAMAGSGGARPSGTAVRGDRAAACSPWQHSDDDLGPRGEDDLTIGMVELSRF